MKELLISQIAPIVATAIVAILIKIIYQIGKPAIQLLLKLKEEAEQRIKSSGHEEDLKTAKEVWNTIEEKFRITENVETLLGSKADEFDKLLLQKIPGLSQQNIDDLRQAIAGEFNKGKEAVLSQVDALKQLQDSNTSLQAENSNLKDQLSKVQAAVTINTTTQETATSGVATVQS